MLENACLNVVMQTLGILEGISTSCPIFPQCDNSRLKFAIGPRSAPDAAVPSLPTE